MKAQPSFPASLPAVVDMAKNIFGLREEELDRKCSILELGLDSLMIVKLGQEIERIFGVALETQWFLTALPSLTTLAEHVDAQRETAPPAPKTSPDPSPDMTPLIMEQLQKTTEAAAAFPLFNTPASCGTALGQAGVPELFAIQLKAMQEMFAGQLQAFASLHKQPLPASKPQPQKAEKSAGDPTDKPKKGHMRGFVLDPPPLEPAQRAFVDELVAKQLARTAKSREICRKSPVLADWKSTLSYRPELGAIAYPIVADRMQGGRFTDVDGNDYIDIAVGMGVHFLGHNPPYVAQAVQKRMARGFGLGPQCDRTAEAADNVAKLTGMERVAFCNTGSEAVMFAMRLARAKSGKNLVATFNGAYHGTFDGVLASMENGLPVSTSPGTPSGMVSDVLVADYNSESAFALLEQHAHELAAVLVEPVQSRRPGLQPQQFLRRLRAFTKERDIALIFDEMVNGFRIALGGAQEHFGIRADMALYGKIVGGGLPVGVIAGKKDYLDYIDGGFLGHGNKLAISDTIAFGGTFCRHPLSMEAVCETTAYLLAQGPELQKKISALTTRLADNLNYWFQENEVPMRLMNFGPQFLFESYGAYSAFADPIELLLFFLLLQTKDIYTWERRTCGLSSEHSEAEVNYLEQAVKESVQTLRENGFAFRSNIGAPLLFFPMSPTQERLYAIFQRPHGQEAYHLPLAWRVKGKLDVEKLTLCLGECIKRHEALRTSFHQIDGKLLQKIIPEPCFKIEAMEFTKQCNTLEALLHDFIRPFDLETAPLLRAAVAKEHDNSWIFILDLLHITADGASLGLLLDELNTLMQGNSPLQRPAQFNDLQNLVSPEAAQEDTDYWSKRLSDMEVLKLPFDFPSLAGSTQGGHKWLIIDQAETAKARQACRGYGITLNMFLHGVYTLLLHTLTGGERFCVGMADGGRFTETSATAVGMFVNTVPLDFSLNPATTLQEHFAEIRKSCALSMARNHAPYGSIVQSLRFSPANTMLSYEKADHRRPSWPGLEIEAMAPPTRGAMYDFAIDIVEMEGSLRCNLLHSAAFRPESAAAFGELFAHLLNQAADNPEALIKSLSSIPPRQHAFLKKLWTDTLLPLSPASTHETMPDLFLAAAQERPQAVALVGQKNSLEQSLSYHELDELSQKTAVLLNTLTGSEPASQNGRIIGILTDRSTDFVITALGIMRSGAAYMPLSPEFPPQRIAFQLKDAGAVALVVEKKFRELVTDFPGQILDLDAMLAEAAAQKVSSPLPWLAPKDLAYVIYTSGTTGRPKGVMIEHHSLAGLCRWFVRHYEITRQDCCSAYAPFVFDASIWEIFPALTRGAQVHILAENLRRDLPCLHEYLRSRRITVAYFLSQVAERIEGETLPDLRLMLSGGDVLHRAKAAGNYRHCNTYGPTEYTVTTSSFDLDGSSPVPIGRAVDNTQAIIVDKYWRLAPVGVPGELCLAGEQRARGYLNLPEQTAAVFVPNPFASDIPEKERPTFTLMYKTGDLCRLLPDGDIEYMGRLDEQVKIRGQRVEPAETARVLQEHPDIAACFVMALSEDAQAEHFLCAYIVPHSAAEREGLAAKARAWLEKSLPPYMLPRQYLLLDALPQSSAGKIDRKALPRPRSEETNSTPPATLQEKILAEVWAGQLNAKNAGSIGQEDNFFELGGDSIKALMITANIRNRGYSLKAEDIFHHSDLKSMARMLRPLQAKSGASSEPGPEITPEDKACLAALYGDARLHLHKLAPLQHGLLFHHQLDDKSPAYIEQTLLHIKGPLNASLLQNRLRELISRHEILRTAIVHKRISRPLAVVLRPESLPESWFVAYDLQTLSQAEQQTRLKTDFNAERRQGFDLEKAPLLRLALYRLAPEEHALIFTVHHVIADGWSTGIFFSELFKPAGETLPPALSYRSYVDWLEKNTGGKARHWWKNYLEGLSERTEIPGAVRPKSVKEQAGYAGQQISFALPGKVEANLRALCTEQRLTMNVLLQSAWAVLLARCNRHEDIVFGEVVSGRPPELAGVEELVGLCSNTVPVRINCKWDKSFAQLAQAVQENALAAQPHSCLSLAEIQKHSPLGRETLSHFFVMENYPPAQGGQDISVKIADSFSRTNFDFAVVWEQTEQLAGSFIFNRAVYPEWQVQVLKDAYVNILESVQGNADCPLADLGLSSEKTKLALLHDFAPQSVAYPPVTVVELFKNRVKLHPDKTALVFRDTRLSYAELDSHSEALAHVLRGHGAGKDRIVAILLNRGLGYTIAALATLKAGAAFLPLAPDLPPDRLRYQLTDSAPVALISGAELRANAFEATNGKIPFIDIHAKLPVSLPDSPLPKPELPDLAYVIYTSGTTGQPKGVLTEHAGLANQALWTARHYGLTEKSVLTMFAAHAFDVSVWDIFPGLISGAELHPLDETVRSNLDEFSRYLQKNKISDAWLPPHLAEIFLREYSVKGLSSLTAGGDIFLPHEVKDAGENFFLYNNYGPTECSITATSHKFRPGTVQMTIGPPVDNTPAYILDPHGHLQPVGMSGELYLGGVQTARGYLNLPELNAEKFLPDPFIKESPANLNARARRMYKTGDLCRRLPDGNLEYLGRIDQQVKIRGQRIELAEIEATLLTHPAVQQCSVLARQNAAKDKRLCAYIIAHPRSNASPDTSASDSEETLQEELRAFAAAWLPRYMVPEDLVFLVQMPLTSTGKIDKKRLPAPEQRRKAFVAPKTEQEKLLAQIFMDLLQTDKISVKDDFFSLGGDSIKAITANSRLGLKGYRLDMKALYRQADLEELALTLQPLSGQPVDSNAATTQYTTAPTKQDEEFIKALYPDAEVLHIRAVTPMQEAMLFTLEHNPEHNPYFISNWAELRGCLEPEELGERLAERLARLTQKHEALRSAFVTPPGSARPWQIVLQAREASFAYSDLSAMPPARQNAALNEAEQAPRAQPIDMAYTPLFKVLLFKLDEECYRVLLMWHHCILDGWSLGLLTKELFEEDQPETDSLSFRVYLDWLEKQDKNSQLDWWRAKLADSAQASALPLSANEDGYGKVLSFRPDKETDRCLRALGAERGLTLNSLLEAAWGLLLTRYANQEEALCGTVISGRPPELAGSESIIGLCVTTVPLRFICSGGQSFIQTAKAVQNELFEASQHGCCSLAELRALSGSAFSDVLFVMENQPGGAENEQSQTERANLRITPLESSGYTELPFVVEWTDHGRLRCTFHHSAMRAADAAILRDHYLTLLEQASMQPDAPISALPMLTPAEEKRILAHSAGEMTDKRSLLPVPQLFARCRELYPQRTAVEDADSSYTYAALYAACALVARNLQKQGIGRGHIVGVLLPRSANFVLAAMGIMLSGAAYLPLDVTSPPERLRFMLEDAEASLLISHSEAVFSAALPYGTHSLDSLLENSDNASGSSFFTPPQLSLQDLAYVIYTSGSTGKPKGTLLEHRGLANLCAWQHNTFPAGQDDVYSFYAPVIFDASVYEIFPALTCGAKISVVPEKIRTDAEALAEFFRQEKISVAFLSPLVGKELIRERNFPSLRVFTLAGDKPGSLPPAPFKLMNCYGPTEFTVCATSWTATESRKFPPIGRPITNSRCYVLDNQGHLQPYGLPGELHISGIQLARGYLNRPEQNAAVFIPNPFGGKNPDYARMYKSGDKCRLLPDGNLEFLGRLDEQITIRGQRIEPEEITQALLSHPAVKEAVVTTTAHSGASQALSAYVVPHENVQDWSAAVTELFAHLDKALPAWMLPSFIIPLSAFPLTVNGKVDKKALPQPLRTNAKPEAAPVNPTEKLLAAIWGEVLGIAQPGRADSFFTLGGDSITAMQVISRVRSAGFALTTQELFHHKTIETLAQAISLSAPKTAFEAGGQKQTEPELPTPSPAEWRKLKQYYETGGLVIEDVYPLTPMQEGLIFHSALAVNTPLYIEQSRLDLHGEINPEHFEQGLQKCVARHAALRTIFAWKGFTRPWQIVLKNLPCAFAQEDLRPLSLKARQERLDAIQRQICANGLPLERGPLFNLTLCRLDENHYALLISFHHSILDGWSIGLLTQELLGPESNAPRPQAPAFRDYVAWMLLNDPEEHRAYWQSALAGAVQSKLPYSHRDKAGQAKQAEQALHLDADLSASLTALASSCGVTLNTLLQTAWGLVLARYNNSDEAVFGTVLSGRHVPVPGIEKMAGLFVNTVPVRHYYPAEKTFAELLEAAQTNALKAEEHSSLPLVEIQKASPLGSALFNHLFVFENLPDFNAPKAGGLQLEGQGGFNSSNYDFSLILEAGKTINGRMQYSSVRFAPETVSALGRYFINILRRVAANPNLMVSRIALTDEAEEKALLQASLPLLSSFTRTSTVFDLFAQSVCSFPTATALACGSSSLSYAELDARSSALAALLQAQGAGPEKVVAILLPRCLEQVSAMLAIVKTGAAFLPVDPDYPDERIAYLLADSAPTVLITQSSLLGKAGAYAGHILKLDQAESAELPFVPTPPQPENLAYIIYTSGTTGQPKGVMVDHSALSHFCQWHRDFYNVGPKDVAGHVFSFSFDGSLWGIFPILAAGGSIHIIQGKDRDDPWLLREYFNTHGVTLANIPTALCEFFFSLPAPKNLRLLTTGGDALRSWHSQPYAIYNEYGPCETTVMATCHKVTAPGDIPIGKALADLQCLILDSGGLLQPAGFPGELHISGIQTARGYVNAPQATKKSFVPNPYLTVASPEKDGEYRRMYRTGDLCRLLPDGALEFLGRVDDQVSIRGHRIETGEIEQRLTEHPEIAAAVALAHNDPDGDAFLAAYVVPAAPLKDPAWSENIMAWLALRLPAYMLPRSISRLESLPLTPNGKVDKVALATMHLSSAANSACCSGKAKERALPRGGLELAVARIWKDVLKLRDPEMLYLEDNFFALGGDSLKAMRLAAALESTLGVRLDIAQIMTAQNMASMCALLQQGENTPQALIPLRNGEGSPVILMHSVGGSLLCYRELLDALPPDQPVFALPPLAATAQAASLAEMAAPYAAALAKAFPQEKVLLAGLCMGGLTAWEIASQLLSLGCPVSEVLCLNTRTSLLTDEQGLPLSKEALAKMPKADVPEEAVDVALHSLTDYEGQTPVAASTQEDAAPQKLRALIKAQFAVWGRYIPPVLPLRMTCIRPLEPVKDAYLPFETQPLGWEKQALGGVREFHAPGNHFTMLKAPQVAAIAEFILEKTRPNRVKSTDAEDSIPLTPIQRWFFELPTRHGHFFQSVVLRADRPRSDAVYRKALASLVQRHPLLRAGFAKPKNAEKGEEPHIEQFIRPKARFGFRHCRPEQNLENAPAGTAEMPCLDAVLADIAQHFDLAADPLLWCVKSNENIALLIHHLAVDGVSWRVLQQDFSAALAYIDQQDENTTLNLDPALIPLPSRALEHEGSFKNWAKSLNEYAKSAGLAAELPYWRQVIATLPPSLSPLFTKPDLSARRQYKELASLGVTLEAKTTQLLLGPCHKAFGTQSNDLILTGLLEALRRWRGSEAFTLLLEGHGRQELFPDINTVATVGWFTTLHPLILQSGIDLRESLLSVQKSLANVPQKGIGYGLLYHCAGHRELALPHADVLFNFLGDTTPGQNSNEPLSLIRLGSPADVADDFPQEAALSVTAYVQDGQLAITLNWLEKEFSRAEAQKLLDEFTRALRAVVGLCLKNS